MEASPAKRICPSVIWVSFAKASRQIRFFGLASLAAGLALLAAAAWVR